MLHVTHVLTLVDPATPNPALSHAVFWTERHHATLHAVHVRTPEGDSLPSATFRYGPSEDVWDVVEPQVRRGDLASDAAALRAGTMDAPSRAEGVLRYAQDHAIDLIVIAPQVEDKRLPVLRQYELADVIRRAPCLVLVVSGASVAFTPFQRLLAPVDLSRRAQEELAYAKELAALYGASLDVLHVLDRPRYVALSTTDMLALSDAKLPERTVLRRARALFDNAPGPSVDARFHVAHGSPTQQIAAFAERHGNDLLVLASHGSTGQPQHPLGTVAAKTLRRLALPVFLVKSFGLSLVPLPSTAHQR